MIKFFISFHLHHVKNGIPNKTCFYETWLSDSRFMKWVACSVSKENAQCKLCKCNINLSNMDDKACSWKEA